MKNCGKCKTQKAVTEFSRRSRSKDGLQTWCKGCMYKATRDWAESNPENTRKHSRENKQRDRATNPEKYAKIDRARDRANPDRVRRRNARRRARERNAPGTFTQSDIDARFDYYGQKCRYCGSEDSLTLDHRIPLNRGGSNWPSNFVPACVSCNCSKQDRTEAEFMEAMGWKFRR